MKNAIHWFEIPVLDFERSVNFYNQIFQINMPVMEMMGKRAFFPKEEDGISGCIVKGEGAVPGDKGPLLFLNAGNDLNQVLSKISKAGGKVIMEKTFINPETGSFAIFLDTEGNKVALHSPKI
jgi:uncharacterized protein